MTQEADNTTETPKQTKPQSSTTRTAMTRVAKQSDKTIPINNESPPQDKDMITISKEEYEKLLFISQTAKEVIRDLVTKVDSTIHQQKGQLSQCLNQTVRAHNILADLEAMKDSILTGGVGHKHGN